MRTTERIDDELYRRVEERAAREGRTVAGVLEDAVRIGLGGHEHVASPPPLVTPTYGSNGVVPGVDLSSNHAWYELLDQETPIEQLR